MSKPQVTTEELIQTLSRSSIPTVVTEGNDDYKFYRRVENSLSDLGVSLFPVGGRNAVLEIFKRRFELKRNNVVFISDKDLWIFSGIPAEYSHRKIVYTLGYSIENDLYCDGEIEHFLHANEKIRFDSELNELLQWYSFAVARILAQKDCAIADHPSKILDDFGRLNTAHMNSIGYSGKDEKLFKLVKDNYQYLLRGKNLIELILRRISRRQKEAKFSRSQIMEIGAARMGPNMRRISDELRHIYSMI